MCYIRYVIRYGLNDLGQDLFPKEFQIRSDPKFTDADATDFQIVLFPP